MNKDVLFKIKLKNGSYHGYLRPHNQQYYKTYPKYRSQSKKACRKTIDKYEKPISREVKILNHFLKHVSHKLNYSSTTPDLKDGNKTVGDNCQKVKMFLMHF